MTLEERWSRVEQPILEALATNESAMSGRQLQAATGIELPTVMGALRSLKEDGYIDGVLMRVAEADYPIEADGIRLLPRGLRQTGVWPIEDWAAGFIAALERAIQDEPNRKERTKLERVLEAVKGLGGTTLSAIIATAVGFGAGRLGL